MLRTLPKTAVGARQRATQPPETSSSSGSPTEVLSGLPLPSTRSKAGRQSRRTERSAMAAQEGHAQDVLHLFNAGWFGPWSQSKAEALFCGDEPEGEEAPPPAPRRGRQAQQQQQRGQVASDGSPSSSSQRSTAGGSDRSAATRSQAVPPQQAAQAAAVQDLPGIGTWAGRYRLFGQQDPPEQAPAAVAAGRQRPPLPSNTTREGEPPGEPQPPAAPADGGEFGSPVVLRPGGFVQASPEERGGGAAGSAEVQEHAWRWRFSRKWATEQRRYYEQPEAVAASAASDDLDAMEFTQACGTGLNLQVLPTRRGAKPHVASVEEEGGLAMENSASTLSLCQFDVDHSETTMGLLSAEMSPCNSTHGGGAAGRLLNRTGSGAAAQRGQAAAAQQQAQQQQHDRNKALPSPRLPSATKSVLSLASKAQELLRQQGAIEAEVQDRWQRGATAGDAWAGRGLRCVAIDMWGRFRYCVLRVSDGVGRTRFIVRGRAGAAPAALLDSAVQEAAEASRRGGLPPVTVEIVGGGVMEWREDTDRELHLSHGDASLGGGGGSDSPSKTPHLGDVTGLTASLVRQALPCHFRITTGSGSSRAAQGKRL